MFMKYKFDFPSFWNEDHYNNFQLLAERMQNVKQPRGLEVGALEGRTTIWLVDNIIKIKKGELFVIESDVKNNLVYNLSTLDKWIRLWKGTSYDALMYYNTTCRMFDFIYLDGDHNAKGLMEDIMLSWKTLNVGGYLLIDDYEMQAQDPWFYIMHKEFEKPRVNFTHPRMAIDAFLTLYRGLYEIVAFNYQVMVRKVGDINGNKNLLHGDDSQNDEWVKQHK